MGVNHGTSIYGYKNNKWSKIARLHTKNHSQLFGSVVIDQLLSYDLVQIRNKTCEDFSRIILGCTEQPQPHKLRVVFKNHREDMNENLNFDDADFYRYLYDRDHYQMLIFKSLMISTHNINNIIVRNGFSNVTEWYPDIDEGVLHCPFDNIECYPLAGIVLNEFIE